MRRLCPPYVFLTPRDVKNSLFCTIFIPMAKHTGTNMAININHIKENVRKYHSGEVSGHDWGHISRVHANAVNIAAAYPDADISVVECAALMHDVADHKIISPENMPQTLAMMESWLREAGGDDAFVHAVMLICGNISFSKRNTNTSLPIEGLIVQDADRLDATGAVGIARAFAFGGARGRAMYSSGGKDDTVSHFYEKLLKLKDMMNTAEGRRMAGHRHDFMERFLEEFFRECGRDD